MKMYDFTLAPSPRRVRIFLAEKRIDVELVQVDIMRNANRTPEFYKKNPLGSLPILELEDGSCLSESVAICRYFEELQPEPPLFGVGAREQALVEARLAAGVASRTARHDTVEQRISVAVHQNLFHSQHVAAGFTLFPKPIARTAKEMHFPGA